MVDQISRAGVGAPICWRERLMTGHGCCHSGTGVVKVTAVRIRYERIAAGWRRATAERRTGLLGELEMLALQLPAVQAPEDPDRAEIVALRSAINELITEITAGVDDPT